MNSLHCPITNELFRDPVIGTDGHTYERKAITKWLQEYGRSPLTKKPMVVQALQTNYVVTKIISELNVPPKTQSTQYQFKLNVDIRRTATLFKAFGKAIYNVEWISREGPPIVLVEIDGATASREASFYVQLSCHPHIVRTFGLVESSPGSMMLLQEYAPAGDLSELLREHAFRPSERVLLEMFVQLSEAMICLTYNGIVHGDLACRNVLVFRSNATEPQDNVVKLTDFGLTRASTLYSVIDSTASSTMATVPIRYAAPEILRTMNEENYSEKSDVYSMGVLMWEACSLGVLPYSSVESDKEIRNRKLKNEKLPQPSCSHGLWNIMRACWHRRPQDRPDFRTLRQYLLRLQFNTIPETRQEASDDRRPSSSNSTMVGASKTRMVGTRNSDEQARSQVTFDPDQRLGRDRVSLCPFCEENLPSEEAMRIHLLECGNKTEQCRACHQFVRRSIFIYHRDNNCTNPEEAETLTIRRNGPPQRHSVAQFDQPRAGADVPTPDHRSHVNDDSAFSGRRNMAQFSSMRLSTKNSRNKVECEFCHVQYERTEYTTHKEKCFRSPANGNNRSQRAPSQPILNSEGPYDRQATLSNDHQINRSNSTNQRNRPLPNRDPSRRQNLYNIQEAEQRSNDA